MKKKIRTIVSITFSMALLFNTTSILAFSDVTILVGDDTYVACVTSTTNCSVELPSGTFVVHTNEKINKPT